MFKAYISEFELERLGEFQLWKLNSLRTEFPGMRISKYHDIPAHKEILVFQSKEDFLKVQEYLSRGIGASNILKEKKC